MDDYTNKYKGEQIEVALFGGEYQEGVLTAYCSIEDVPHIELNGHILVPLQNVASLHCSSRCDAPEPDWPPHGLAEDEHSRRIEVGLKSALAACRMRGVSGGPNAAAKAAAMNDLKEAVRRHLLGGR